MRRRPTAPVTSAWRSGKTARANSSLVTAVSVTAGSATGATSSPDAVKPRSWFLTRSWTRRYPPQTDQRRYHRGKPPSVAAKSAYGSSRTSRRETTFRAAPLRASTAAKSAIRMPERYAGSPASMVAAVQGTTSSPPRRAVRTVGLITLMPPRTLPLGIASDGRSTWAQASGSETRMKAWRT